VKKYGFAATKQVIRKMWYVS